MSKIFTLIGSLLLAGAAYAQQYTAILSLSDEPVESNDQTVPGAQGTSGNVRTWENGFKLVMQRSDKNYSKAETVTYNGETYLAMKCSKGAANNLVAPTGFKITNLAIHSYINVVDDGNRNVYWKQISDNFYTEDNAQILTNYRKTTDKSDPEYMYCRDNLETVSVAFPGGIQSVYFQDSGKQQICMIMEVTFEQGTPEMSGIGEVVIGEESNDAPAYNVLGVKVDSNYKGIVIKNGKKYLQK